MVAVKECLVREKLRKDQEFSLFYNSYKLTVEAHRTVDVRAALFGGRVEAFVRSCELTQSEIDRGVEMRLLDVVSLFP